MYKTNKSKLGWEIFYGLKKDYGAYLIQGKDNMIWINIKGIEYYLALNALKIRRKGEDDWSAQIRKKIDSDIELSNN